MKHLTLTAVLALALSACATGRTSYAPADSDGSLGYTQTQIENDRYRVKFTAKSAEEANDLALLRAAELAVAADYSHFEVVNAGRQGNPGRRGASVGVGFGGVGVGIPVGGSSAKAIQTLEVKFRRNGSDASNVYDAAQVVQRLGRI